MGVQYELKIYKGRIQADYQINSHITIFSILEGSAQLNFEKEKVELRAGELYAMNFGKLYGVSSSSDAVMALLEINYEELLKESGKKNLKFSCDTLKDTAKNHYHLKKEFSKLLRLHVIGKRKFEEWGAFYDLLSILMNDYALDTTGDNSEHEDDRMMQARLYLHTHYQEKITLEDICGRFYFSTSTFTRNFKKQTNKSMIQYLNEIRMQSAKKLLLENDRSVTDVAMDVGFADAATFIKLFKKLNGVSPLKFKQQIMARDTFQPKNEELIDMVDKNFLINRTGSSDGRKIYQKNTILNENVKVLDHPWTKGVGVEKCSDLLDASVQRTLLKMKNETGLRYIRIPGLFTSDMSSSYDRIDQVMDFLIDHHIIPVFELSGRKKELHVKELMLGVKEVSEYHWPKSEYQDLVLHFMDHVYSRYSGSVESLSKWIWEFQYERSLYTLEEYVSLFNVFYEKVHLWNQSAEFGGYGIDIYDWDEQEIRKLSRLAYQPDYFSVNLYPYQCVERKAGISYLERNVDLSYLEAEMTKVQQVLKQYGYANTPVYVTQWNTTLEDRNIVNDSFIKPSLIILFVVRLSGMANLFIYDVACDTRKKQTWLYGGRGIVSKDGIEKPVFNVLKGLNEIGSDLVLCSDNLVFGYLGLDHLYGICFNHKNFNMSYYQKAEMDIREEDIHNFFDDQDILEQEVMIPELRDGTYRIRIMTISEQSSVLYRLKEIGDQIQLDHRDLQFIKNQNGMDVKTVEKTVEEGLLELTLSVKPNEVAMVQIYPVSFKS